MIGPVSDSQGIVTEHDQLIVNRRFRKIIEPRKFLFKFACQFVVISGWRRSFRREFLKWGICLAMGTFTATLRDRLVEVSHCSRERCCRYVPPGARKALEVIIAGRLHLGRCRPDAAQLRAQRKQVEAVTIEIQRTPSHRWRMTGGGEGSESFKCYARAFSGPRDGWNESLPQ